MTRHEVLATLSNYLRAHEREHGILRLGVFGSAARDQLRDDSDIDVVVELSRPDLFALVGIKRELEKLLRRKVDIVRYRERMSNFLKQRIDRDAVFV